MLPAWLRDEVRLPDWRSAVADAHFPPAGTPIELLNAFRTPAQVRLILEEFLLFQVGLALRRRSAVAERKPVVPAVDERVRAAARAVLPFTLTGGQRQALKDIVDDMVRPAPMQRLLQGDVGAGKTIVALLAAVVAMENGLQVAFMAPTEILAEQHYPDHRRLLAAGPYEVALLTGSVAAAPRARVLADLASGRARLVVGTHALVQEAVTFARLGLVVVDEQHRFGVMQRAVLRRKGWNPDVLVMTATPIPRTLALTVYGDLDVSVIRDLPPGRAPVDTQALPQSRRGDAYALVRRALDAGRQAFVVYPLVEESSKVDVRAATEMADHLATEVFPEYRLALVHGRLRPEEKDRVMRAFAAGDVHVLVSTTVIEVGIDVPNAAVMVVEHAERFGLAQLHQLRGRVGRGAHPASCLLLYQEPLGEARRGAAPRAGRHDGRVRHRREGPRAARARRCLRHAPVGDADAAVWRSAARSGDHGAGPPARGAGARARALRQRARGGGPGGAGPTGSAWRPSADPGLARPPGARDAVPSGPARSADASDCGRVQGAAPRGADVAGPAAHLGPPQGVACSRSWPPGSRARGCSTGSPGRARWASRR